MTQKAAISGALILMVALLFSLVLAIPAVTFAGGNGGSVIAGPGNANNGGAHAGNGGNGGGSGSASGNGGSVTSVGGSSNNGGASAGSGGSGGTGGGGSRLGIKEMLRIRLLR